MFIIVPKRAHRPTQKDESAAASKARSEEEEAPVRIATACDSCRVKKTKCNGAKPCAPCKKKRVICVYSRPTARDMPVSQAQLSLLDHQQQRLSAAVQRMASVIAKYETGVDHPSESFDVVEQLEKYAPQHAIEEQSMSAHDPSPSRPVKRRRGQESAASSSPSSASGGHGAESVLPDDCPFQLQSNPTYAANLEQLQESYESMLQLVLSMTSSQAASLNSGRSTHRDQSGGNTSGYQMPVTTMPSIEYQNPAAFDFMSIVDWDASLQHLQNSQHLLFSDLDPNFEPLLESSDRPMLGGTYPFNSSSMNDP